MVVDVTILDNSLSFPRSAAERAVRAVMRTLAAEPNVIYDLENEHNSYPTFTIAELAVLAAAARAEYPRALVTVSNCCRYMLTGDWGVNAAGVLAHTDQIKVDMLAPHFDRTADWYAQTAERTTALKNYLASVHVNANMVHEAGPLLLACERVISQWGSLCHHVEGQLLHPIYAPATSMPASSVPREVLSTISSSRL